MQTFTRSLFISLLLATTPATVLAGKTDAFLDVLKAVAKGAGEEAGKAVFRALLDDPPAKKSTSGNSPPNVVALDTGSYVPAPGYLWVHPDQPSNFAVQWTAGKAHPAYDNVVAASTANQWNPASGYQWTSNAPEDFTVRRSDNLAASASQQTGTAINRAFKINVGGATIDVNAPIPYLNVTNLFAKDTAELRDLFGHNGISLLGWLIPDENVGTVLSGTEPEFSRQVMIITTTQLESTNISQAQYQDFTSRFKSLYADHPEDIGSNARNVFRNLKENDSDLAQVTLDKVTPLGLFHEANNMICATNLSRLAEGNDEIFNAASECWILAGNRIMASSSTVFVDVVTPEALASSQELSRTVAASILQSN